MRPHYKKSGHRSDFIITVGCPRCAWDAFLFQASLCGIRFG